MKPRPMLRPVQLFVCTNRRAHDDALGGGCGARGDAVHAAFQAGLTRRGGWGRVWLVKTGCLGVCPKVGCTVAAAPGGYLDEVVPADVDLLLELARRHRWTMTTRWSSR